MSVKKEIKLAYGAATLYAFLIGLSFLFSKIALEYAAPIDALAYRFLASFVALFVPVCAKWIQIKITKEKIIKILPLALFYPIMFFSFQTFGLMNARSSEAGIIQATAPVFVMILAQVFLKEKTNYKQKISILISVLGVLYIMLQKGSTIDLANTQGVILLLLSVLSFSSYNILARKLLKDFTNWEISYIMLSVSFIFFAPLVLIRHLVAGTLNNLFIPLKESNFIISILYLGVLSTLVTSMLNNYALSKLEASKVSVFGNLGTIISMIAGVIFLQEQLYYYHFIGSTLIIAGVLGTNLLSDKQKKATEVNLKP